MNNFTYLRAFISPFKRPKLKIYIGKIKYGTPYFYPRIWKKFSYKDALDKAIEETRKEGHIWYKKDPLSIIHYYKNYKKAIPKKIGFDFVDLGWKTKWSNTDYRYEWGPLWSFVFFKWQICLLFIVPEATHYWEAWLYYILNTDKNKPIKERIGQCQQDFPLLWISYSKERGEELIDYYSSILKQSFIKSD